MSEERIDAIQTRWSMVRQAHGGDLPENAVDARRALVMRYSPAVRKYVGAMVRNNEQADDLAQDVMMRLMRGDFAGADPDRGRFRDLLKTAIRNMVRNHWDKSGRRAASDAGLDAVADSASEELESVWVGAWQKTIIDQTFSRMLAEDGGKPGPGYQLLKLRAEFPDATSDELAERLTKKSGKEFRADATRQLLKRTRARFVAFLLDEVRSGLDDESDERVQQELADLGLLAYLKE